MFLHMLWLAVSLALSCSAAPPSPCPPGPWVLRLQCTETCAYTTHYLDGAHVPETCWDAERAEYYVKWNCGDCP